MNAEKTAQIKRDMEYEKSRTAPPEGFPKFPDVPAGRYTDPDFFALEQEAIWSKTWLCAAHEEQLPEKGSFIRWDAAGVPLLIVRGRDDRIRALYNTCSHRGGPVTTLESGQAPALRCGYHSWTYDLEGQLIGVPDERDFVDLDKSCRALKRARCESWGNLVFVNRDPDAVSLTEYLGPIPEETEDFQLDKLRFAGKQSFELECNWKVAVDAFLETYHLKHIHPHTVSQLIDHEGTAIALFPRGHSRMPTPVQPDKVDERRNLSPPFNIEGIGEIGIETNLAYNVFPNLITPMEPTGFPILTFWPIDLRRSRLEALWLAADWGEGDIPEAWEGFKAGFGIVLAEDTQFLPWIQKSVESPAFTGIPLNYQERRIYHLHEEIDRTIGIDRVPPALRVEPLLSPYLEKN